MNDRLTKISQKAIQFRDERDWKQFHNPKNLAEAISIESGELLEKFLWMTTNESVSPEVHKVGEIKEEIADILIFLIYLCNSLNIDLSEAVEEKIEINRKKYPIEKARGSHKKYKEF
jgi:NTP pyrophosphatase (non-canonical NTP hydrolase)